MRKVGMGAYDKSTDNMTVSLEEHMEAIREIDRLHELIAALNAEIGELKATGNKMIEGKK